MGEKLTDADIADIIDEIDEDGSGTIDQEEFMLLVEKRIRDQNRKAKRAENKNDKSAVEKSRKRIYTERVKAFRKDRQPFNKLSTEELSKLSQIEKVIYLKKLQKNNPESLTERYLEFLDNKEMKKAYKNYKQWVKRNSEKLTQTHDKGQESTPEKPKEEETPVVKKTSIKRITNKKFNNIADRLNSGLFIKKQDHDWYQQEKIRQQKARTNQKKNPDLEGFQRRRTTKGPKPGEYKWTSAKKKKIYKY